MNQLQKFDYENIAPPESTGKILSYSKRKLMKHLIEENYGHYTNIRIMDDINGLKMVTGMKNGKRVFIEWA